MKTKTRKAMAEALVDGWSANSSMRQVIAHVWALQEMDAPVGTEFFAPVKACLGSAFVDVNRPAKQFIASAMSTLNEMLWAGRTRDSCIAHAIKLMGGRRTSAQYSVTNTRERDRRTNWGTVK